MFRAPTIGGKWLANSTPPINLINSIGKDYSASHMSEPKQQGFKTLLDDVRENNPKSLTVPGKNEVSLRRLEKDPCPHLDGYVCEPSKKFRKRGEFPCSGMWFETCQIYLLVKKNGGDPEVLALEG